jgi:hypothetical protein
MAVFNLFLRQIGRITRRIRGWSLIRAIPHRRRCSVQLTKSNARTTLVVVALTTVTCRPLVRNVLSITAVRTHIVVIEHMTAAV